MYRLHEDTDVTEEMLRFRDVYIAAPFFDNDQIDELEYVETELRAEGFSFFSPCRHVRYKIGDPPEIANRAYELNKRHIVGCKFVVAVMTHPDMGTAWELGFGNNRPILAVTSKPKVGLNLMVVNAVTVVMPLTHLGKWTAPMKATLERSHSLYRISLEMKEEYKDYWTGDME